MKKTLFLLLLLSLPLLADVTIDGSIFPSSNLVTQTSGASMAVTDTQKTYYWDAEDASLDINYDYDVAALYTNSDVSDFYIIGKNGNINLTAELGAIYLSYAHFYSDCVLTTNQTKEDTAYGKPQIIIEEAEIHSDITLNTVSATLRNNLLFTSGSVVVNGGPLIVQGVSGSNASLEAKAGINLDTTKSSYEYDITKELTLTSAGTITIGEQGTTGSDIHTLSGVSSLAVNYTGNGGDDENFDVVNNDIVKSNVTIQAANGRVDAGILNDSGSTIIIAKLMYLTKFEGGSLTTETSGATWIKGDLVATGSLSLSGSTLTLGGANNTAANDLTLEATEALTGTNTSATYSGNSISLTGKSIKMSGTFSGGALQATATNSLQLVTLGKTGSLIGATTLTSNTGDINVTSFVGSSSLTATAAGTLTLGSATAAGTVSLTAAGISVTGSVISTAGSGTSTLKATGGDIAISGALSATDTAEVTATGGISIIGTVSAGTATFTPGSGNSVSIGGFSGNSLSITQAGAITVTGGLNAATGATLSATGDITVSGAVYGNATVTSSDGSVNLKSAIGTLYDVAGDIALTPGAGKDITISSFCGNSLTIAQAGAITITGDFISSMTANGSTAQLTGTSLTVNHIQRTTDSQGIFRATTTSGGMSFAQGVSAYGLELNSAGDITFGSTLHPGGAANLQAAGNISVAGDANLKSGSTVQAATISFNGGLTATGTTLSAAVSVAEDKDVTLTDSTLNSISMSGALNSEGTVTISNQTAGLTTTSLTLNGGTLTLGNHNVDLTTSVLTVNKDTVLNANLVLLSNAEVTLAKGTSIKLGCTLTLTDSTSFTLTDRLTPGTAITLMSGVDKLITEGSAWTTDGDTVSTILAETYDAENGTYTYTTGASSGSLKVTYDTSSGEGGTIVMTPEPATATLSLLALAALAFRRRRSCTSDSEISC